jgi:hypothetical protein
MEKRVNGYVSFNKGDKIKLIDDNLLDKYKDKIFEFVEVNGEDVTADVEIKISTDATGADVDDMELSNVAIYTKDGDKVSDEESSEFDNTTTPNVIKFSDVTFEASDDDLEFVIKGDVSADAIDKKTYKFTKVELKDPTTESDEDVTGTLDKSYDVTTTVEGAVLTVKLKDADDSSVNDDADEVAVARVELNAEDSGDDIVVSELNIKSDSDDSLVNPYVEDCAFYDGDDKRVSSKENADKDRMLFDLDDVTVTAGTKETLTLKCNLTKDLAAGNEIKFKS